MSRTAFRLRRSASPLCLLILVLAPAAFADEKEPRKDLAGDPLPQGAVARLGSQRWRHDSKIAFVAFTDGGKLVLTSCADGIVHVWDSQTGKERGKFGESLKQDPNQLVRPRFAARAMRGLPIAAISADGKTLVMTSGDQTIRVRDVTTEKELTSFEHGQPGLTGLAITSDGKQVLSFGGDATIKTWDAAKGTVIREYSDTKNGPQRFQRGAVSTVSSDGALAATAYIRMDLTGAAGGPGPRELHVVDLKNSKEIQNIKSSDARTNYGLAMPAPAFSLDGKRIAWLWADGTIHVYGTDSWKEVQKLGEASKEQFIREVPYAQLLFAPDGKSLAALASDETICVFDLATGKVLQRIGEASNVPGIAVRRVHMAMTTLPDPVVAWSPDSKSIAQGRDNLLRLWNVENGKGNDLPAGHSQEVFGMLVAADGKSALTLGKDNTVRQWNLATARETRKFDLPAQTLDAILLAPGLVASVAGDGSVRVSDVIQGKDIATMGATDEATMPGLIRTRLRGQGTSSVCAAGNTLTSCETDMLIHVFDVATGKERATIKDLTDSRSYRAYLVPGISLTRLACTRDGKILAVRYDRQDRFQPGFGPGAANPKGLLRSYDLRTNRLLWEVDTQMPGCQALAFAPDGRSLALIGAAGDSVSLLETATGKERFRWTAAAAALAFSDDGQFLGLGGNEGALTVVDLRAGKPIASFQGGRFAVRSLAFSHDAATLLSGLADGTVLVWDLHTSVAKARRHTEVDAETAARLWDDLADLDGTKAYRAVTALSASPHQAVTLLKEQLKPAGGLDDARIDKWIADLDSDDFESRTAAMHELGRLGERARAALEDVLDEAPSLEVRKQVKQLLGWLEPGSPMPDLLRETRALEILQTIATPEARSVLETLAKGARGRKLTRDAAAVVKQWPQSSQAK